MERIKTDTFEEKKELLQKKFEDRAAIFGSSHAEDKFFGNFKNRYPKCIDEFVDTYGKNRNYNKDDLLWLYQHAELEGLLNAAHEFGLDTDAMVEKYNGQFNFELDGLYYEFYGDDGCGWL